MGWLFYTDQRVKTYADQKAEIERLCTFETEDRTTELICASKVGTTWYAAVRVSMKDGSEIEDFTYKAKEDGSFTFAAIFLTAFDQGCWGYKDMEESAGPVQARAPVSLLNRLSELKDPDSYAHDWRKRCRAWADIPTYNEGDTIRLANPLKLDDGTEFQIVTATRYRSGRRMQTGYRIKDTGGLVRLPRGCLEGSSLVTTG
ncbi:DUF6927 domain-containing protein [Palleronia caenipelagi]|uniref:DUF6927 domain-containing protein n=1 Tax=Palleronia caenipelagi TaxID=2489174 RepID=A0A547PT32_9RHOB|nr:hypothetical protein [Palleronia caenipelagi]TRD17306.1 hypothetical protein FEV53_13315 [Palleronia caenipelagi]